MPKVPSHTSPPQPEPRGKPHAHRQRRTPLPGAHGERRLTAGSQRFERGACGAPDVGAEAFFGLAFVTELEGAQFAVDELQDGDLAVVEGSAVEDEVEEVVPGAVE
jgi:hypothetical protein